MNKNTYLNIPETDINWQSSIKIMYVKKFCATTLENGVKKFFLFFYK